MSYFKAGQMVECIKAGNCNFYCGNAYEITRVDECGFWIKSHNGYHYEFSYDDFSVYFKKVTPKFTAVSGDQSLFDLVGASDDELYIRKLHSGNGLIASEFDPGEEFLIAERKPYVEKYVPEVGDCFDMVTDNASARMKCIYIDCHHDVWAHDIHGNVAKFNDSSNVTLVKVDK